MDTPRILAIADLHLCAPPALGDELTAFYSDVIGLHPIGPEAPGRLAFRGYPRFGPRLFVELAEPVPRRSLRRAALIQIDSLSACTQKLEANRTPFIVAQGLWRYDRRLTVADPAANRIELVVCHEM